MQRYRLTRELEKMTNSPPRGICVFQKNDKLQHLEVKLTGPEDSPYKKGIFTLEIVIPEKYPFTPPSIKFITKIYHPNIDDNGRICLDLIKMPPSGNWKPTIGLEGLLIAIRMLLQYPNPEDPLMADIAEEFKNYNDEYVKKAEMMTAKYATE
ncbi:ubiquitin-conjugating enzyme E2 T [Leptinotarsa decemlineata]|uniref:ubiquitin-conjugating enzyme E2 T n=1 Tax=Leptinotarsa decemlineata TaxID=7539 RepID=UPI000C2535FB|nr:ubiquitin-conjugating enzyme E2 T-like [Leptinotarsa decemlineata]